MSEETVACVGKHYSRIRYSSWGFNKCLTCDPVGRPSAQPPIYRSTLRKRMGSEKEATRLRRRSKSRVKTEEAEEGRNTTNGDTTSADMKTPKHRRASLGHLRGIVLFILLCFLATISYLVRQQITPICENPI